jgi:hypothetical protein
MFGIVNAVDKYARAIASVLSGKRRRYSVRDKATAARPIRTVSASVSNRCSCCAAR